MQKYKTLIILAILAVIWSVLSNATLWSGGFAGRAPTTLDYTLGLPSIVFNFLFQDILEIFPGVYLGRGQLVGAALVAYCFLLLIRLVINKFFPGRGRLIGVWVVACLFLLLILSVIIKISR